MWKSESEGKIYEVEQTKDCATAATRSFGR